MLFRSFELQWTLCWFLIILANYFGAFRDTYFWDEETKKYILRVWKDWHNVKILELTCLIASARLIPIPLRDWKFWIPAFCWLVIRWASWEFWMHEARMSGVYGGNKKWLGGIFYINRRIALLLMLIFVISPYFL